MTFVTGFTISVLYKKKTQQLYRSFSYGPYCRNLPLNIVDFRIKNQLKVLPSLPYRVVFVNFMMPVG